MGQNGAIASRNCFLPLFHTEFGDRPNTVSESTVLNTELSEFFCPHRVPGGELREFLSAYYWCAKANSPSFFFFFFRRAHRVLPENLVSSLSSKTALSKQDSAPFPMNRAAETCPSQKGLAGGGWRQAGPKYTKHTPQLESKHVSPFG